MLRLSQLFFLNLFILFVGTLVIATAVSYFAIKSIELENYENYLKNNIELLKHALNSTDKYDTLAHSIKQDTAIRVTIISENGKVLGESDEDKALMENHLGRLEIVEANSSIYGKSLRYSRTIKTDFLYVAKKVRVGDKRLFIRLALSTEKIQDDFFVIWVKISLIFALSIFVGVLFSLTIHKKITNDTQNLLEYLKNITDKRYNIAFKQTFTKEFKSINGYLKKMSEKLSKQDRKKKKFTNKLKELNRQQSDIISAISHEFKNPIAAVMGYSQTLIEDDPNVQIREKFLQKIYNNSHKISVMIDRLAMLIKFENKSLTPKYSKFNIKDIVEESKSILDEKYRDREILVDLEDTLINADYTMIELVLINLMDNALKYSHGDIKIELKNNHICVIDYGKGIAKKDIEKITEKFYRVNGNSWNNSLGLGLYLVEFILTLHNTKLEIYSEEGKGSRFGFYLPNVIE